VIQWLFDPTMYSISNQPTELYAVYLMLYMCDNKIRIFEFGVTNDTNNFT
jgi:hypothetical protein